MNIANVYIMNTGNLKLWKEQTLLGQAPRMLPSCRLVTNSTVVQQRWLLFVEARVRSRGSPRGIPGGKCERFSPSTSVLL